MLILYTTEDGKSQIKLRAEQQTVWLAQLEMAELFATTKQNWSAPVPMPSRTNTHAAFLDFRRGLLHSSSRSDKTKHTSHRATLLNRQRRRS